MYRNRINISNKGILFLLPEYFTSPKNPLYDEMCRTLQNLQSDSDRDVRFFACPQQDTYLDNDGDFNPDIPDDSFEENCDSMVRLYIWRFFRLYFEVNKLL